MFVTTGSVNHTIFVAKNYSLFESSIKSYEKSTYFEKIEPEENYKDFKKGMTGNVDLSDEPHMVKKKLAFNEIKFDKVTSCYIDSTNNVLRAVSFVMKSKEKIGIMGPLGSGRTSLIKLLPQIQLLKDGKIFIDKYDISKLD